MSAGVILGITMGAIVVLLLSGIPVAFALSLIGLVGIYWLMGGGAPAASGMVLWRSANNYILTAVPLFIFMGVILEHSGISAKLYAGLSIVLRRLPGGLLLSNIASCAIFAAITGSSAATEATIGTIAIPEQEQRGYNRSMIVGSLTGGGALGILIPPSIIMIVYASMVGESVGRLFAAGLIPGIVAAILFMVYIAVGTSIRPGLAPREKKIRMARKDILSVLGGILPPVFLIGLVLGTIYLGVATPTEAAALGAVGALILAVAYRTLNWQTLKESGLQAVQLTCMMLFIVIGAQLISFVLANLEVPRQMAMFLASLSVAPIVILIGIYILYLMLGCFFDGLSMMVLTLPVIYPVILELGFDSVWFGVILVILIEVGMLTPPVGINLYIMQGIAPQCSFTEIVRGSIPYFCLYLSVVGILTAFPIVALWLPAHMIGPG